VPGSAVQLPGVSLNDTRIGFLRVLERMRADLVVEHGAFAGAEPTGTVHARFTPMLIATVVSAEEVPSLVDEVPLLALLAARAAGTTRFEGVGELRVKESDRLEAIAAGLTALGVVVRVGEDWLEVDGPAAFTQATLDSLGDHRLAMCWALAGLVALGPVDITRFEAVDVSYPEFADDIAALGI
jgi:3-phosphoshikimate 1-carboxyvinyltransferase